MEDGGQGLHVDRIAALDSRKVVLEVCVRLPTRVSWGGWCRRCVRTRQGPLSCLSRRTADPLVLMSVT